LLIWAVGQRRWRFVGSFGGMTAVLFALSFLFLPTWFTSFVQQVVYYPAYTVTGSPLWVITSYYFSWLGKPVEYLLIAGLLLYLFWRWRWLPKLSPASNHFLFIIGLTLIITNIIIVRTATTNYLIMYIPLFMVLHILSQQRHGNVWVALFYGLSILFTWALFLATIEGDQEHPITFLPLPLGLLLVMIWLGSRGILTAQRD